MNRVRAALASALLLVISSALSFEALAIAFHRLETGTWYYGARPVRGGAMPDAFDIKQAVFHPYFAFLNRVGRSGDYGADLLDIWTTNNHGFQFARAALTDGCCDLPYSPGADEVVVAIFGGSVGSGFGIMGGLLPDLEKSVQAHSAFAGRRVRVLNFAMSGYRQPQQAIVLAHYLTLGQKIDLLLNIDGFNELAVTDYNLRNGADALFPAVQIWGAMGRELESQRLNVADSGTLLAAWHRRSARDADVRQADCSAASCWLWYRLSRSLHNWRAAKLATSIQPIDEATTIFPVRLPAPTGPSAAIPGAADSLDAAVDGWFKGSIALAALARGAGARYLHILQPNQWFPPEQRYAPIDPNHPYEWAADLVRKGYPMMRARMPALRAAGVHVFDASALFVGDDNRLVFIDDCCHYTKEGYATLFRALADQIVALE